MTDEQGARDACAEQQHADKLANYLTMLGHMCSDINQGALTAILPFLVAGDGYTYFQATLLLLVSNIASAVIQPLFGWIGDKRPTPWFMALGIFLAGLGLAGIGLMHRYAYVVASALVSGIGIAMFHPEGGRLSNLAAGARKSNGMSIFAIGGKVGFFIGPIMCAASLTAFGLRGTAIFVVPTTVYAIVLLCFNRRFVALGTGEQAAQAAGVNSEHWGLFGMLLATMSLHSIISYGLMAFIPLFLMDVLGQGEAFSSTVISVFAIAGAIATALSGRVSERVGTLRLLTVCFLVAGAGVVCFALNGSVAVAVCLTVVLAAALDVFYPSATALGMGYIPRHLGMASGLSYGVAVCVGGVAEPALGLLGDAVGLVPVIVVIAVLCFAAAVIGLLLTRAHARAFGTQTRM